MGGGAGAEGGIKVSGTVEVREEGGNQILMQKNQDSLK